MAKNNRAPREKNTAMTPSYLLFLALFILATAAGFVLSSVLGGASNISATANYSIIAILFLAPIMMIGNNIRVGKFDSEAGAVTGAWFRYIGVFLAGLLIYIIFALIVDGYGTFRGPLFGAGVLNVALFGAAFVSFTMLLNVIFDGKKVWYLWVYAIAVLMLVIEVLMGVVGGTVLHDVLYAVSISKLTYCMRLGILDWKTMLLYIAVIIFSIVASIWALRLRRTGAKPDMKSSIVPAILLVIIIVLTILPNSALNGKDVTPAGFFSLGDSAKSYLEGVEKDVEITVADTERGFINNKGSYSTYFLQAERVINEIAAANDHITLKYDPDAANGDAVGTGDIVVTGSKGTQIIQSSRLFNFATATDSEGNSSLQVSSSRVEEAICSAIADVLDANRNKVAFLMNGSEHENYKNLAALMEENGCEITYVDINETEEIPDVRLAVIFAPSEDWSSTITLENYMYNGGDYGRNLLYVSNADIDVTPEHLSDFLNMWGVAVTAYTIVETDEASITHNSEYYGMNEYIEYSFISDYTYLEDPAVVPYSRVIVTKDDIAEAEGTEDTEESEETDGTKDVVYRTLLQSKDTCCVENDDSRIEVYNNYKTAIISSFYQQNLFGTGYTGIEAHVGVIGSEEAFDSDVLSGGEYSNARYFADVIDELMGRNYASVQISAKTLRLGGMDMTDTEKTTITGLLAVIPIAIGAVYGFAMAKRRKKED